MISARGYNAGPAPRPESPAGPFSRAHPVAEGRQGRRWSSLRQANVSAARSRAGRRSPTFAPTWPGSGSKARGSPLRATLLPDEDTYSNESPRLCKRELLREITAQPPDARQLPRRPTLTPAARCPMLLPDAVARRPMLLPDAFAEARPFPASSRLATGIARGIAAAEAGGAVARFAMANGLQTKHSGCTITFRCRRTVFGPTVFAPQGPNHTGRMQVVEIAAIFRPHKRTKP